jgi:hypothetical protein
VIVVFSIEETVGSVAGVGVTASGIKKGEAVVVVVREGWSEAVPVGVNGVANAEVAVSIAVDPAIIEAVDVGKGAVSIAVDSSGAEMGEEAVSMTGVDWEGLARAGATTIAIDVTSLFTVVLTVVLVFSICVT